MDLETHLLETLRLRGAGQGLTHGELREKCGPAWRRALAQCAGQSAEEATLGAVKDFVHRLWVKGRVIIEPPCGEGKAVRVWHPEKAGIAEWCEAPAPSGKPACGEEDGIAQAYEKLSQEGRSPYVFLSQLQRETSQPLEALHRFLRREQEAGRAVLSVGDWAAATGEEQAAALQAEGRHYIKVRLVSEPRTKDDHGTEN